MMASNMDTSFPFPRRPWGQRVIHNATSSPVQAMLNRELGLPGFLKQTDSFANPWTIRPTLRQLIYQRIPSLSEETVEPLIIKLNPEDGKGRIKRAHIPNTWVKIITSRSEKIQLVGDYLRVSMPECTTTEVGNRRNLEYTNSFYKLQDDISLGFKRFRCPSSRGYAIVGEFIDIRYLGPHGSGLLFMTLTAEGIITLYDISHHSKLKSPRILALPREHGDGLRCTDMHVDYDHSNLYVVATLNGTARQIFKISYPSLEVTSKKLAVNQAKYGTSVKMVIDQSVALVTTSSEAYLESINDYFLPGLPDVLEIPLAPNSCTRIKTMDHDFSMMDTVWPPVTVTKSYHDKHKLLSTYHFTSMHDDREIWSLTFNLYQDCTFNPVMTDYTLVLQRFNETYSIMSLKKDFSSDPPTYHVTDDTEHELLKTSLESNRISHRASFRPMRTCAREKLENDERNPQKRNRLIAMDYCDTLDLVGVSILEAGLLVVSLYESRTHKLFKRLPSVKIREFQGRRKRIIPDDQDVRCNEMAIDFDLDSNLIFITIEYSGKKEYYCLNLIGDDAPLIL